LIFHWDGIILFVLKMNKMIMPKRKTRKDTPELIDLPEDTLDAIKSRISTGTLLEEDKHLIVIILTSYAWLMRQLQFTKISILRLKNLFGFNTEKRQNKKKPKEPLTSAGAFPKLNGLHESQPVSLNALQGLEQESLEKK
jgi:hypothetical protein